MVLPTIKMFKVVETTIYSSGCPLIKPVISSRARSGPLTANKAKALADKLNEKSSTADFDPNRIVSYTLTEA